MVYERGLKWYEQEPWENTAGRSDHGIYIPKNVSELARDRRREGLEPGLRPTFDFPKELRPVKNLRWWERLLHRARNNRL